MSAPAKRNFRYQGGRGIGQQAGKQPLPLQFVLPNKLACFGLFRGRLDEGILKVGASPAGCSSRSRRGTLPRRASRLGPCKNKNAGCCQECGSRPSVGRPGSLSSSPKPRGANPFSFFMNRLQDKVAVITGGNSGIGFATAQEFSAEGARVVVTGRNPQAVQEAVAQLGGQAVGVVSDTGSMADVHQLAGQVQAHHARIDVLFVNAGVAFFAPIAQVDEAFFDAQFNINVKGAYFTIQQLLPLMNDHGSIILTSSTAAHMGMAGASVYAATKAALTTFARTLSAELLERNIRVNVISPGPIDTPILGKMGMPAEQQAQTKQGLTQLVPMKRFGTPRESATVAVFFASDDSSFVTGDEIIAGGGVATL